MIKPETRLFQEGLTQSDKAVSLTQENLRIVRSVLRLRPGQAVDLIDGKGIILHSQLEEFGKKQGSCRVLEAEKVERGLPQITLLQGTPKGEKSTWLVQKAVEWGVHRIVFLETEHAVVRKSDHQIDRWTRVAREALRQSGNPFLPELEGPISLSEALKKYPGAVSVCFDENRRGEKLRDRLKNVEPESVSVAVGPEGGWSDAERKLFKEASFIFAGFGPHILRTETAGLSAIAFVNALLS